ncbi:hypothetical protein DSM112329_04791 [Paraconexibacter sp. AEG42_29]|uniref:SnoaL-like domain-containing protein n=1 Tax=Paraconexibacter sp. AEG42_29 TaxID=2997339 RepID=A0AAU7B1U8_9ACTN
MPTLDAFIQALHDRDPGALAAVLADDIQLHSPLLDDPIVGREQVVAVLDLLFEKLDTLEYGAELDGGEVRGVRLSASVNGVSMEGVELVHFDADGRVDEVRVQLRPLSGLIALQNVVAPAIGAPVLQLTPISAT